MKRVFATVAVLVGLGGWAWGQTTRPARTETRGDKLAAGSLLHSANRLRILPGAPARTRRLVLHLELAKLLTDADPLVNHALANIVYAGQRRAGPAGRAAEMYLRSFGNDHAQGLLWLGWSLADYQTAGDRIAWLSSVVQRGELPSALRAEAASLEVDLLDGQGLSVQAGEAVDIALKLDPYNVRALTSKLSILSDASVETRVRLLLSLAAATGGQVDPAARIASILQSLGLHSDALFFHEHVWRLTLRKKPPPAIMHDAAVRYCNALLDAGQAKQAIEQGAKLLATFTDSVDLRLLQAEALQMAGQGAEAIKQQAYIERTYWPTMTALAISDGQARQLAMFFLETRPQSDKALLYARRVERNGGTDVVARRILGAAELTSGKAELVQAGREKLEKLIDKDLYAAAMLADYYARSNRTADARRVILAGAAISREGPAYRKLAAIAAKQKVQLPPIAGAEAAATLVAAFDRRLVTMASEPEKYVSLTIRPVKSSFAPGEPIEVEISLGNISKVAVPLGAQGLLRPSVALSVAIDQVAESFDDLPVASLPAGRYLAPGGVVKHIVRLDVGKLSLLLARRPLTKLALVVTAVAAPYQYGAKVFSAADGVRIKPITIVREDILPDFRRDDAANWPIMYRRALGLIVGDMKHGRIEQRMRAARQVGSLLALVREIETGRSRPPRPLDRIVTKPVLLTMLRAVLKDSSDVVRAEMVAALEYVAVDEHILSQLQRLTGDPSPLVRYRLAELLGATGASGAGDLMKRLGADRSALVRGMAEAFKPGR